MASALSERGALTEIPPSSLHILRYCTCFESRWEPRETVVIVVQEEYRMFVQLLPASILT